MRQTSPIRRKDERGFTLTEMLIATVIVIFGLIAVAQLVPASVMLNSNNRNDGTALAFAERQMETMRAQPLSALTFADLQGGVFCPTGQACELGTPGQTALTTQASGCPVVVFNGAPVIDFSATPPTPGTFGFTYTDPNDPFGGTYDVRWAVFNTTNSASVVTSRRIILGVFRRGMQSPTLPVTLDVQVER